METADDTAAKDWRHLPTMKSIMRHFLTNWEKMKMFHDVVFVVGDESEDKKRIGAHKLILALRSEVFSKMLYPEEDDEGDDGLTIDEKPVLERGKQIVQLGGVNSNAFRIVLSYMYSDKTPFDIEDFELAFNVILLAKRFGLEQLRETTVDIVKRMLDNRLHSAVKVFELSIAHGLSEVEKYAFEAILNNADVTLHTQHFLQMKEDNLCRILKDDNLVVNEVELFLLVVQWAREECKRRNTEAIPNSLREVLGNAIFLIRFPVMDIKEFMCEVKPVEVLTLDLVDEIQSFFLLKPYEGDEAVMSLMTSASRFCYKTRRSPEKLNDLNSKGSTDIKRQKAVGGGALRESGESNNTTTANSTVSGDSSSQSPPPPQINQLTAQGQSDIPLTQNPAPFNIARQASKSPNNDNNGSSSSNNQSPQQDIIILPQDQTDIIILTPQKKTTERVPQPRRKRVRKCCKSFKCDECSRMYSTLAGLDRHKYEAHGPPNRVPFRIFKKMKMVEAELVNGQPETKKTRLLLNTQNSPPL